MGVKIVKVDIGGVVVGEVVVIVDVGKRMEIVVEGGGVDEMRIRVGVVVVVVVVVDFVEAVLVVVLLS